MMGGMWREYEVYRVLMGGMCRVLVMGSVKRVLCDERYVESVMQWEVCRKFSVMISE